MTTDPIPSTSQYTIEHPSVPPSAKVNPFLKFVPSQSTAVLDHFQLESGETLYQVEVAYRTWGTLNETRDNVMVICHALTGSSDVEDWWGPLMGPGQAFDPDRFFIFCANFLGSPYGSASPLSVNVETGERYGPEFPATTIRDDVRLQKIVLDNLGVSSIAVAVGGSMGGMAVLEWPLCCPDGYVRHIVPIATSSRHSAWGISWAEAQRQSIYSDPKYADGYYELNDPPATGLAAARMAALLTYRSRDSFEARFGRKESVVKGASNSGRDTPRTVAERAVAAHNDGHKRSTHHMRWRSQTSSSHSLNGLSLSPAIAADLNFDCPDKQTIDLPLSVPSLPVLDPPPPSTPLIFSAQLYLRYQGNKFVNRFDANCYLSITRKIDSHDVSRGREPWPVPLKRLPPGALLIAISSDGLFTLSEQQEMAKHMVDASLVIIESPEGHDGFLLEFEQINRHLLEWLRARLPSLFVTDTPQKRMKGWGVKSESVFGEVDPDISRW